MMRLLMIFAWVVLSAVPSSAQERELKGDLLTCLPRLDGLTPDGFLQKVEDAESLFSVINGGAVVYVRHGFLRGLFQAYKDENHKFFNLEIIEMKDGDAARTIYRLKTKNSGKKIDIGDEAVLEDYYLIFRQGRFYLSVTGPDSDKETRDVVIRIAEAVGESIKLFCGRPKE